MRGLLSEVRRPALPERRHFEEVATPGMFARFLGCLTRSGAAMALEEDLAEGS
jgi:hypothetical protein